MNPLMNNILTKVDNYITRLSLLRKRATVIAGISGGPDSVCLALILAKLGYDVIAVHCNFHLRGEESMRDERFVENLCKERNIKLQKADFDTIGYAKEKKISIEMAARELRYERFRHFKDTLKAEAIAVGHHRDDNTETFFLNAIRGTGIKGLCAIQPRNEDIVRPLLCLSRDEVIRFLAEEKQGFVTDRTNLEDEYSRNKIRLNVMPVLTKINEGAASNLETTIENLNEVAKIYQEAIKDSIDSCCTTSEDGEIRINKEKLNTQPSPISVLHEVLSPLGFNREQLKGILHSYDSTGKIFQANGRRALVDREEIIIEGENSNVEIIQTIMPAKDIEIKKDNSHAYIDYDKIKSTLSIRKAEEGDTFAPFGMKGRRKLVSDFLTDKKLTRFEKEKQLLVCDGEEIVWVVGRRSSELYRIDNNTTSVVVLSIIAKTKK